MILMFLLNVLVFTLATAVVIAVGFVATELIVACLPLPRTSVFECARIKKVVLIPAHNEEVGIAKTIASVLKNSDADLRVLVVADNCTDNTAQVASKAGAEVVVRTDPQRRGKGYALDFGLQQLATNPPEAVIVLDADCEVEPGAVKQLAAAAVAWKRPVQGRNLCCAPDVNEPRQALSEFAFRIKNHVRPRGLSLLGGPCLLTGTGMALPWDLVRYARLANGNIVEDMQLGIDLTLAGHAPRFLESAAIRSELPTTTAAAETQRTRWEHGHLATALSEAPQLLARAWRVGDVQSAVLALELAVPPLALLIALWAAATFVAGSAWLIGATSVPFLALLAAGGAITVAVPAAWGILCRDRIPARTILALGSLLASKLTIYQKFLTKRQKEWVRTDRGGATATKS
jgi:cellulose synthase/poly-beta-1,6-N-acetylglucosamine synthase-like glycosyltransferase